MAHITARCDSYRKLGELFRNGQFIVEFFHSPIMYTLARGIITHSTFKPRSGRGALAPQCHCERSEAISLLLFPSDFEIASALRASQRHAGYIISLFLKRRKGSPALVQRGSPSILLGKSGVYPPSASFFMILSRTSFCTSSILKPLVFLGSKWAKAMIPTILR